MKRIQLSDRQPSGIREGEVSIKTIELKQDVLNILEKSDLSYVEKNKALYLAVKELYVKNINF